MGLVTVGIQVKHGMGRHIQYISPADQEVAALWCEYLSRLASTTQTSSDIYGYSCHCMVGSQPLPAAFQCTCPGKPSNPALRFMAFISYFFLRTSIMLFVLRLLPAYKAW